MVNTAPETADTRIAAVDGLRGLAVSLVVAHHLWTRGVPGGFIGVDIFFVISGFVITGALMRQGIDLRQFYVHRFFRIIPPVVPVIIFVLTCTALGLPLGGPKDALLAIMSLMNWARALEVTNGKMLTHFWSLAVEEQFYLVWPLLLGVILRARTWIVPIIGAILAFGLIYQIALYVGGASFHRVYNGTDTRFSQLMVGCLLFFLVDRVAIPQIAAILALVALCYLTFTITPDSTFYLTVGIGLSGFFSALLIGAVSQEFQPWHRPLLAAPAQWLGSRSYAIYLWHFPLLGFVKPMAPGLIVGAILVVGLTCLAAEASMRFVERPSRRLRSRFDRSEQL